MAAQGYPERPRPGRRCVDEKTAQSIIERLQKRLDGTIVENKKTKKKEAQRLPLSLSSLQVLAGKRYGYTPQQVLDTAQELYERKLTTIPVRTANTCR